MTDLFALAKTYAGLNGAIVEIDVGWDLPLTRYGSNVFIYVISNAKPFEKYYRIEGMKPVGVLTRDGRRIR